MRMGEKFLIILTNMAKSLLTMTIMTMVYMYIQMELLNQILISKDPNFTILAEKVYVLAKEVEQ